MSEHQTITGDRRPDPLFEGDRGVLTVEGRRALVLLLKNTHLAVSRHPQEWEALLWERERIQEVLNELFLVLVLDEQTGVAYKAQAQPEGNVVFNTLLNQRPLQPTDVRVLLHLRELIREGAVAGETAVTVTGHELLDRLTEAYPEHKGDHLAAREQDKAALRRLAGDDILLPRRGSSGDDPDTITYTISPAVETILTPARVKAFAEALREGTGDLEEDPSAIPGQDGEEASGAVQADLLDDAEREELP